MLPNDMFINIVKHSILVSIDLIIYNDNHEVLVGLRNNKPAQNLWFVPGGRIYKGDTIKEAFTRITGTELIKPLDYQDAQFLGVYQHMYEDNTFGEPEFGTHYIVLAYEIKLKTPISIDPGDRQHRQYKWMAVQDLINDCSVHPFTKNYFLLERQLLINNGVVEYIPPE